MPNSIIAANPSYRREVLKAGDLFFIQKAFIEIWTSIQLLFAKPTFKSSIEDLWRAIQIV